MGNTETSSLWLVRCALLIAVIIATIIVRVLYVFWPYPEALGINRFRDQIVNEQVLLRNNTAAESWRRIYMVQQATYTFIFTHLGFSNYLVSTHEQPAQSKFLRDYTSTTAMMLYYSTVQVGMRLGVTIEMLPWFLICGAVAVLDGLCGRSKRRHMVSTESSFLYSRARDLIVMVWGVITIVYLLLPWPISLKWIFIPAILLFTAAVRTMTCYFKKYI